MQTIRFVHAADLHLDVAFSGIASDKAPAELTHLLRESTFLALTRLTEFCEQERPDFLLLAGDVYNKEDRSLRAQLELRDACKRLEKAKIPVFIAHGNHDPLSSGLHSIHWPENVTIFDGSFSSVPLFKGHFPSQAEDDDAELVAVIHGISHTSDREHRNLALKFHRSEADCLQIGLLHCAVEGNGEEERYAPCTLDDLRASNLDYWALGHIHGRRELCSQPLVVYSGNTQGLHINEEGEKGCLLVTAEQEPSGWSFSSIFHPLGPVVWRIAKISLDKQDNSEQENQDDQSNEDNENLDWLEDRLRNAISELAAQQYSECEALIVRLELYGRTGFNTLLHQPNFQQDLLDRLRRFSSETGASGNSIRLWVKDMEIHTRPLLDRESLLDRQDLLGDIFRMVASCHQSPQERQKIQAAALNNLFTHKRAKKLALPPFTDEEIQQLLDDAADLCAEMLMPEAK